MLVFTRGRGLAFSMALQTLESLCTIAEMSIFQLMESEKWLTAGKCRDAVVILECLMRELVVVHMNDLILSMSASLCFLVRANNNWLRSH